MASAKFVEMPLANNNPSQGSSHPHDHFQSRYVTPGYGPFSYLLNVVMALSLTEKVEA